MRGVKHSGHIGFQIHQGKFKVFWVKSKGPSEPPSQRSHLSGLAIFNFLAKGLLKFYTSFLELIFFRRQLGNYPLEKLAFL